MLPRFVKSFGCRSSVGGLQFVIFPMSDSAPALFALCVRFSISMQVLQNKTHETVYLYQL